MLTNLVLNYWARKVEHARAVTLLCKKLFEAYYRELSVQAKVQEIEDEAARIEEELMIEREKIRILMNVLEMEPEQKKKKRVYTGGLTKRIEKKLSF